MPARQLTDAMVAKLPAKAARYTHPDPQLPGLYVRVQPSGSKTFAVIVRGLDGRQVLHTIGSTTLHSIAEARDLARDVIKSIKAGRARPQSFESVAEQWFKRHVQASGLLTAGEIRRSLDRDILPAWSGREFTSIRRGDVARLLDRVEDNSGPVAADKAFAHLSRIFNWYLTRHDGYASPVVKGMKRSKAKERARDRILSDDEIRTVWKAEGTFGDLVKVLLLTGQRREKVASMRWQDVGVDGVWTVPQADREKGVGGTLKLPDLAVEILRQRDRLVSNPHVFAGSRGASHFSGYSKAKAALDAKLELEPWTVHDLRRTARSLMSRAGVRPDIAERVLGHAIEGVGGIYDRHDYAVEKADALRKLAALIETILQPSSRKVARLRG